MPAERPRRKAVRLWREERTFLCVSLDVEGSRWKRRKGGGLGCWFEVLAGKLETYSVVVLDGLGDEGVDEQGQLLLCWCHLEGLALGFEVLCSVLSRSFSSWRCCVFQGLRTG